jgi:nucleotide-binding universal stress UspA family protein
MTASIDQPGATAGGSPDDSGGPPRVVVGVDGSLESRAALVYALIAVARHGADLDVVSSYGVDLYYLSGVLLDVPDLARIRADHDARVCAMVTDVLDDLAVSFAPGIRDVDVTPLVSATPAAQALLDRSVGAALLVVGTRGRGVMRSALLGSVALHCVTHAACPVVVVPPAVLDTRPSPRVLVGVDGSDGSRVALAAALDEASWMGAEVEAVATYVAVDYWTDLGSVVIPSVIRRLVEEVLAERRDGGKAPVPNVRTEVVEGSPGEVLVHRGQSADLLVVGSRGRGAFRGLLLGSVALHCAMHAPCPVMVVHPRRTRSAAGTTRPEPAKAGH